MSRLSSRTRLTALAASSLLDSPPEERFDRLTRLAAAALGVPVSLFTLVTPERQFFKSLVGLQEPWASRRETPLSHSFCQHVVTTGQPLVINDARTHPLVSDNLAIDELGVEAYLGVPITSPEGEVLGSLCVIDHQPREWSSDAVQMLLMLVAILSAELARTPLPATGDTTARRAESRLAAIVEAAHDAIVSVDADFRIASWNGAAERIFRIPRERAIGLSVYEIISEIAQALPAVVTGEIDAMRDHLIQGESHALHHRLLRDDGVAYISTTFAPLTTPSGEPDGVAAITHEVTQLVEATRALAESESRLALMAEHSPVAIFEADTNARCTYVTAQWAEWTGTSIEAALGNGWANYLHPEDAPAVAAAWRAYRDDSAPFELSLRLRSADGSYRQVMCSLRPQRDASGAITGHVGSLTDLASREALDRELRTREAFLNGLIDSAPVGIQIYDRDGKSLRMNEALRALLHLPSTDYGIGEYNALTDPVSIASGTAAEFRAALAGEPVLAREHEVHLSHNRNRWETRREDLVVEQSLLPIRDAEGEVSAVIAFVSDITERKRAEERMRQAAELTRSILDAMGDPMVVTNMNGDIIATNPATERLLGPPRNPGASILRERYEFKLLLPDGVTEIPLHETPAARARAGEAVDDFEVVFRQQGRPEDRHLIITARPLNNGRGEVDGAVMVFHDVTERRTAEDAARFASEQIRQVVQTAPVILGAIAADGTVLFIEGRSLRERGLDPSVFVGHHYSDWVPPGTPFNNALQRVLAGEEFMDVYPGPLRARMQQGHHVPLRNAAGEVIGATVALFDITERLEAEAARRQAEKLESLSVLAGGLAHDFNNLLVNILGNAALAMMDLAPDSPARESIVEIESAGRRAAELSRQMLAYSGHGQFFVVDLDLNAVVREVAQRIEVGPHIELRLDPDLPRIQADPAQLRLAVAGVLNNAVEAMAVGGEVVVTSRAVHADAALFARCYLQPPLPEGQYASLEVRDTGAGMDSETLARIFDPFFSTKFIGRGLGLAAVLGIVRGHNGAIEVQSAPGEGTTFRLYFPLTSASPAP